MIQYCKAVIMLIVSSSCPFAISVNIFEIVPLKINWSSRSKWKLLLRMVLNCLKINMPASIAKVRM
jgi:hypothetical protein